MADFDDSDYEERLRQVLRQVPSPRADADTVLARVEAGARRRVRRRRIGGVVASAAVVAAGVVIVPSLGGETNNLATEPDGTHRAEKRLQGTEFHKRGSAKVEGNSGRATAGKAQLSAGEATDPTDVAVSDIAVSGSGDVSVLAESDCPDGPCYVTGSTATAEYRVAPTSDRLLQPMKLKATATAGAEPGIQVGADETNSWTWTDGFYSTHDAGETWEPVELPETMTVEDVQANGERVWAFGTNPAGRAVVVSSSESQDDWSEERVPVGADEVIRTPMTVGDDVAFVASKRSSDRSAFVRHDGERWMRMPVPCAEPVESSTADDTVWLGCRKQDGLNTVVWSHDGGRSWGSLREGLPAVDAVGGIDADNAVVGVNESLYFVDGKARAATPTGAPVDDVQDKTVSYTSVRFDEDGTGYATTTDGALARSDNGGTAWKLESLP